MALRLTSPAFEDGQPIPTRYTCNGSNISPPLEWDGAPPETKSFVLICEDPDAPARTFRHWAVYNILPGRTLLPEGADAGTPTEPLGFGTNDFGKKRYGGPCPPPGHGTHHYHFKLAALNTAELQVPAEAGVVEVWEASRPFVVAEAELVGTYER